MKISLAACTGMSPNGLISRVVVNDMTKKYKNLNSICLSATSAGNKNFNKLLQKQAIITINGCNGNCTNKILEEKDANIIETININKELNKTNIKPTDPVRINETGEKATKEIIKIIENKIGEKLEK